MPFKTVESARKKVNTLKSLNDKQVKRFIAVFNALLSKGIKEDSAISQAITAAKSVPVEKATVKKLSNGNIEYMGQQFPGFRKPIRDSGTKQGKVLVKKGDKVKIVRFGDPKLADNGSAEKNDNFYARFGNQKGMDDPFSALYWSARWLWPRGKLKGKGPKKFFSLSKSMTIDKATFEDKRRKISSEVEAKLKNDKECPWLRDFDDEYTYVQFNGYCWRIPYKEDSSGDITLLEDERQEVIQETTFKVVEPEYTDKSLTEDRLFGWLDKYFGGSKVKHKNIIKQFGQEEQGELFAIEPLYVPPGEVDGHGDVTTIEVLEYMVESLNKANDENRLQTGLFHKHHTESWYLDKAWINQEECVIGDTYVPKGQPIAKTIFTNPRLHELRVEGIIAGLSIGARGYREPIDKDIKPKNELKRIHFDWDHPELTYTSQSQGGAASLMNDPFTISKALKAKEEDLDEDQVRILKEIEEDFVSLEKHFGENNGKEDSSSSGNSGVISEEGKLNKGKQANMSEDNSHAEKIEQLEKALKASEARNEIQPFGFDKELCKSLSEQMANLTTEGMGVVIKALEQVKEKTMEISAEKSAGTKTIDNPLASALDKEAGEEGKTEEENVEKSFLEKIMAYQDSAGGKA